MLTANKKKDTQESQNLLQIESLDPQNISETDFCSICSLEQDIWARKEGLGEYVKCINCGFIHSKQDIFGHIENSIYLQTVSTIEQLLSLDSIKCVKCGSDTKHIYGDLKHREKIRQRYKLSESFISALRNEKGELIGFMDAYIDDISVIFERELSYHYGDIGLDIIINLIEKQTQEQLPDKLFSFSALGTEEKYMNMFYIYWLLSTFFTSIPKEKGHILGITELNSGQNLNAIYYALGVKCLGISRDNNLSEKRLNLGNSYNSDIFVQPNLIKTYTESFKLPIRQFIKKYRSAIRSIIVD
ncbi:MAG: hypothetical protein PHH06_03450 [Candidatus Gracilibacteria bacterium]|nr:hypothetical protein [Candidatus Gracilibacteria bacterium]